MGHGDRKRRPPKEIRAEYVEPDKPKVASAVANELQRVDSLRNLPVPPRKRLALEAVSMALRWVLRREYPRPSDLYAPEERRRS